VVTGPAYLVIEDVPTPFVIPFGYFPNSKGRASGFNISAYGESASRGFTSNGWDGTSVLMITSTQRLQVIYILKAATWLMKPPVIIRSINTMAILV